MPTYNPNDFYPRTGQEVKSDGTTVNEADGYNSDSSQNVKTIGRKQTTIQTHNAVSVLGTGTNYADSSWIDTDGYSDLNGTLSNDATTSSAVSIYWSNDGINTHGADTTIVSNTNQQKSFSITTKARYAKVRIVNLDASATHVMSSWTYLKS